MFKVSQFGLIVPEISKINTCFTSAITLGLHVYVDYPHVKKSIIFYL